MSTRDALNRLIEGGRVVHVPCQQRGVPAKRHFFLEASIHQRLTEAMTGSSQDDLRLAELWADIDRFPSGQVITVADHPFKKHKSAYMARTNPVQEGIFDIRSVAPSPAIRLFGAFCEPDVFLGLTWEWRKDLGGRNFDFAVMRAMRAWDLLLPECSRFVRERIEEHITNDFISV